MNFVLRVYHLWLRYGKHFSGENFYCFFKHGHLSPEKVTHTVKD